MPLECFLLNIILRDLPRKCRKMRKMRKTNADRIPPPPLALGTVAWTRHRGNVCLARDFSINYPDFSPRFTLS